MKPLRTTALAFLVLAFAPVLPAQSTPGADETQNANIKAYVELLRRDIKRDKVAVLTEIMNLTPDEASRFWPIYSAYDKELSRVGDEKIALFRSYIENYGTLSDNQITQIVNGLQDAEGRLLALRKKYFAQVSQSLGAKTAARFLQVEHQLNLLLDLQVCANLPVVD